MEEMKERKNPFCVISKETFGEYAVHDVQTNSSWNTNPYEDYAAVPDDMVIEIMKTRGFLDIELNEEGTEVVSFTAREIPDIPEPEPIDPYNAVWSALDAAYANGYRAGVDSV